VKHERVTQRGGAHNCKFEPTMKIKITLSVLVSLTLLSVAQAVSPPPDGGYSGYNTAEGQNALFSLNTGLWNTDLGAFTLYSDTTGIGNTAVGINGLRNNVTGGFNTAVGLNALFTNNGDPTVGQGSSNCAVGAYALFANTTGNNNTADGAFALSANNNASDNTGIGSHALERNTVGAGNTAIGQAALNENVTGSFNTAVGTAALLVAGGNSNTVVGSGAGGNVGGANHVICIGQGVAGANVDNSCYIDSIWNQPGGSQPVYVNSDGKLGALVSSRRFKDEIKPMAQASEVIYSLEPVSFRYKPEIEPTRPRGFGLIAEDVEKVSPDLVTRGTDGKVNSVRYDQVNAMLLNEFLKARRKTEEQQKQIDALTTQLKEQAEQLHNVSMQVGLKTPERRVVLNAP
jgi:trimeric autotransporter adhesin